MTRSTLGTYIDADEGLGSGRKRGRHWEDGEDIMKLTTVDLNQQFGRFHGRRFGPSSGAIGDRAARDDTARD